MTNFVDFNSATESVVNGWRKMSVTGEIPAVYSVCLLIFFQGLRCTLLRYAGNPGTFCSTFIYDTLICNITVRHKNFCLIFQEQGNNTFFNLQNDKKTCHALECRFNAKSTVSAASPLKLV